ncbi:MAG: SoxR reducing system RseC family protein [Phascolarctobacterium sp.]|uniref:SoxR reducing system RseC family protein n=1 Tax=Phascolarctobacterium sp. TaxID=2049039 RepID=UPI0026DD8C8F|nr:SoxR reducing system RseC family protein [Phascolarctobacterium sp.]MDO4922361.1 SoxR reducing system RseC family protein [Phascolarctobacterium sp.]
MTEIRGIVVKKHGERAEVKVDKTESELTGLPKYLDCWNPVGAKAGDIVGAEYRDMDETKAKLIMYGLPLGGVLAGVAFGNSLATFFHMDKLPFIAGGVALWLIVTVSYARIFRRDAVRQGRQPVIFEIQAEEMVIDMSKKS